MTVQNRHDMIIDILAERLSDWTREDLEEFVFDRMYEELKDCSPDFIRSLYVKALRNKQQREDKECS